MLGCFAGAICKHVLGKKKLISSSQICGIPKRDCSYVSVNKTTFDPDFALCWNSPAKIKIIASGQKLSVETSL